MEALRASNRHSQGAPPGLGMGLAACALTKNEGLALAVLALPAFALLMLLRGVRFRTAAAALTSLVAVASGWHLFRWVHGIEGPFAAGALSGDWSQGLSRLPDVLAHLSAMPLVRSRAGNLEWGLLWPVVGALAASSLWLGRRRAEVLLASGLLGAHVLLYALAFALTPNPLQWHLETAASRLAMHTYPLVLLVACVSVRGWVEDRSVLVPFRRRRASAGTLRASSPARSGAEASLLSERGVQRTRR